MKTKTHRRFTQTVSIQLRAISHCLIAAVALTLIAPSAEAAPPDLTSGGVPNNTLTTNLGPTGMRGWVYHTNGSVRADTSESRQIQVQIVDAGSPAAGVLAAGDVILGADGTGASPVNFTSDARKTLALAIADAEDNSPAALKLLVWRAGTTSTMTLTLRTMGAYSATAPYNCPKSAQILEEGLQSIMSGETAGAYSFGTIGLLAGNNPANPNNAARMARVQTEARALVPDAATQAQLMSNAPDNSYRPPWSRGHMLIFLSEYYLVTGDAQVLPAIRAFAVNIAKHQSLFGTMGHIYADPWPDGSLNGPMGGGYGVVNSAGMPCFLGLVLAKQCGITDAEIDPAIAACSRFYAYYANKGVIPYGEHEPGFTSHENNGKSGLAALAFKLQPNRTSEAHFFTQMATASASEREAGHTGSFFNYVWAPLGAAAGGDEAAAAHFASIRWMLDLNRKWNGRFDYDCLNGEGPNSGSQYYDFRMSTAALLVYALPLRQLHITGRGSNTAQWLTSAEVSDAVAADTYVAADRTTSQLVSDLGNWSPKVQHAAANRLATLPLDSATINQIIALATDPIGTSRVGACIVLGKSTETSLVATRAVTLAGLLTDPQNHVRYMAADAMRYMNATEKSAHLNAILSATASTATPLLPLDEEDPMHMAHSRLGYLLFSGSSSGIPAGILNGSNVSTAPKNQLYPAIKAIARNPIGACRSSLSGIYSYLTQEDLLAVADAIVDVVRDRSPADRMFSAGARVGGLQTMQKYNIAEGAPLSKAVILDDGGETETVLSVLKLYAGDSTTVVPDPDIVGFCQSLINQNISKVSAQQVIDLITADTNPTVLTPLKSIQSVTADNPTLTLPAKWTVLRTTSNDYANGASVYTWRKVHGAGNVSFTPNGTSDSKNTTVLFDGTPGHYLFEVKMSDSRGLTEVSSTVAVTLYQPGGTLPPNNPPVADNPSPTIPQAISTPVTLTGSDPENLALGFSVASPPAHGKLTGTAPYLIYTSDYNYNGPDSFTFLATDSEGQTSLGTVSITVAANNIFPTALYEPFNYPVGSLNGVSGASEVGFSGAWSTHVNTKVTATSLAYGILPTLGGSMGNVAGNEYGGKRAISTSALASNGLLDDGSTLWFSFVNGYGATANTTNARLAFALANSNFSTSNYQYYILNEGPQLGAGLGVTLGRFDGVNGKNVATLFRDSSFGTSGFSGNLYGSVSNTVIGNGQQRLVVGKITWGAASDTIELYEPDSNLNPGSATSTLTVNVDQSTFDTITFARGDVVTMDEIRFGSNYASVLVGNAPMTADTTAPVPGTMAFYQAPAVTSTSTISMAAVSAYDPNDVEYYFTCTAGGGHDSGWQSSPSYTDTGLTPGVAYSYTVKARDKSPARNETAVSPVASATIPTQTTLPDLVGMQQSAAESIITNLGMTVGGITLVYDSGQPVGTVLGQSPAGGQTQPLGTVVGLTVAGIDVIAPTPNPATFAVAPVAINSSSITMTATTGTDPSGVQYLFTETSGNPGGTSSSWQDSPVFTDTGLTTSVPYTYTVTLRDKSPAATETAASAPSSATTNSIPAAQLWYWDGGTTDILTNGNGASAGGTGTWDTTLRNWDAGNVAHTEWNNSAVKTAVFGGTAGTVTIGGGGVTVGDMQLTSATYTIKGDPLTVSGTSNLQINVAANIQSALTGNFGLTKAGTGTLTLSAANTYTGTTTVTGGILAGSVTNFLPLNSNVAVNSGGTFRYAASGNFNALNVALNGGTLAVDGGNSTFGTLALNANSTIDGANTNFQTNTINAPITGVGGLTKTGGGGIRLNGTSNDYTGPTIINSGALLVKSSLYGNNTTQWTPASITVANNAVFSLNVGGAGEFTPGQAGTMFANLTTNVNNNGMRPGSFMCVDTRNASAGTITLPAVLADSSGTGGGAVRFKFFGSSTTALELTGANTYTGLTMIEGNGTLRVSSFNSVSTNPALGTVHSASSSLGAPTTVAEGTIWLGAGGYNGNSHPGTTYQGASLTYTGTGETTDRVLNIGGANSSTCRIDQSGTGLLKFVSNMTATETRGPKIFVLQGSTNGQGEFAGVIPNVQTSAPLTLAKSGAGTWTLSAANLYTGVTTVSGGSLVLANANALAGGLGSTGGLGALTFNGGVIGLGAGDFSRPLAAAGTIGAVTFTGAGGWAAYGSDRAVNLGGASAAITWATAGTGLNAQTLILGTQTATHTVDFQNPLNLGNATRTVRVDNGAAAIDGILSGVLSGTGGSLTKTGFGTLVLSNSNTYTGATNVNEGTLLIEGNNSAAAGTITVATGAKLGGRGTLAGNLTVANVGGLTFDLSTPAASHDRLELVSGKTLTFTGSTSITITSSAGAVPGTYTLVSGGSNIASTILPSLIMPQGWNATLSIAGNQLLLTVTSAVNDAPVWAGDPVVGANATEELAYNATLADNATDADNDPLTFAKVSGPAWLNVAANGALSGTPTNGDVGSSSFTVSVSDGIAPAVTTTLNIVVVNTNDDPAWASNPVDGPVATEDAAYSANLATSAVDVDPGASLTFAKVSGPAWLSVAANGTVSGTPGNSDVGNNSFNVSVSDGIALAVETTLNIAVINTNDAPTWTNDPIVGADVEEDVAYIGTLAGGASDMDAGATLTFAKVGGPTWLTVSSNGTLSGTPTNSDVGSNSFTVSVSDGIATAVTAALQITVIATPPEIVLTVPNDETTDVDAKAALLVTFSEPVITGTGNITLRNLDDSSQTTISAADVSQVSVAGSVLTIRPTSGLTGGVNYAVRMDAGVVADLQGNDFVGITDDTIWNFTTISETRVVLFADGFDAAQGTSLTNPSARATGSLAGSVTYAWTSTPQVVVDGMLNWDANGDRNSNNQQLDATGSQSLRIPYDFSPQVTGKTWEIEYDQRVGWDHPLTLGLSDDSQNGLWNAWDSTSYDLSAGSYGAALRGDTDDDNGASELNVVGVFPNTASSVNTHHFRIRINEAAGKATVWINGVKQLEMTTLDFENSGRYLSWGEPTEYAGALDNLQISVVAVNHAPTWTSNPIAGANATEDAAYTANLAASAADVDAGDTLAFTKVSGPAWLNVAANGTLSGTPVNADVGAASFTVSVSDGLAEPVEAILNLAVINVNDAPVFAANPIVGPDATGNTAYSGSIAGSASDVDAGATLTYSKVSGPAWLSVAADGTLSGTPANGDAGANSFTVGASDGIAAAVTATLNITVINTNNAPEWAGNPVTGADATEDSAYTGNLAASASDVDAGAILTFAKVSGPAWLTVGSNGELAGTPSNANVGANSFTVSVSDGIAAAVQATLNITVINANDAPVFTTNPIVAAGASEGVAYSGQTLAGQATDADTGDTVTYSKVSGPAWLVVSANGSLSGTPPSGSAGLNSFMVRATDSASATADCALQITVIGLPLPWVSADIGTGMLAGSANYNAGTFTQAGSGIIGSTSDKLRFTYQTLSGDGEIIARISALQNTGTSSRVGVMIRDSLATNSKQIFMGMTGTNAYRWVRRTTSGGNTTSSNSSTGTAPNTWVRLVRSGTTITAYKSTNGTSWTSVGSTTNTTFATTCYIGLAVGSGSNTTLNTSQFSNLSVTP